MTDLTEEVARALFDGRPHNNWVRGIQQIPNWDLQPDHLKAVFRGDAQAAIAIVLDRAAEVARCLADPAQYSGAYAVAADDIVNAILALKPEAQS